jgi:hypothetical protein
VLKIKFFDIEFHFFTRAALVRTYNAGLSFALLLLFLLFLRTHLSKYCIFDQFHHASYYTIACTIAMQPCPAALPGSLARQTCPVALPASLARQPCPAALPASLAEKFASCFTVVGRHACMQYCILLLGRQFSSNFPRN